ncbi:hypothetical protein CPAR01_14572 [Colletotrichum paranaense]|uniref:Uncharacterized protein n=1 Tax=Colletotrichum paranaense TaxID=1914294 RepID=A0ABQ9S0V3_9PEZI|nr:uncharacterized protein CPAR01_14572 [Colletotrichum paranaense]KAK1521655.1 hypothetical protein CPAR01_14572 [Colletotrichum paranaense]
MFWRPSGWRTLLSNTVPDQTLAFPASRDPSRFASWRRQPSIRYIVLTGCTLYYLGLAMGLRFLPLEWSIQRRENSSASCEVRGGMEVGWVQCTMVSCA